MRFGRLREYFFSKCELFIVPVILVNEESEVLADAKGRRVSVTNDRHHGARRSEYI